MKFVKIVNGKEISIESDNENLFSVFRREGFVQEDSPATKNKKQ